MIECIPYPMWGISRKSNTVVYYVIIIIVIASWDDEIIDIIFLQYVNHYRRHPEGIRYGNCCGGGGLNFMWCMCC